METQLLDDDAVIAQFLGNAYRGRRFLRYAELEALGLVDNRGSLQNWIDAGAFPRALRIPGKYGKVLVWSAAEVAQLIARRFRERDEHPTEKETGNPEGRPSDSNNDPLAAGRTILRGRRGIYARPENAQAPSGSADIAQAPSLARYDAACRAVAEARSVDEVKDIRNQAVAMAAYARQAKNRDLEADAVEIRLRATRRLDQLRQAQKETVGLNQGAVPGKTGLRGNPVLDPRPTLASQGIDKGLAHQARVLGAMTDDAFERKVSEARDSAARVFRRAVREAEIAQQREERRARTALGGSIDDLHALIGSGFRAGVIAIDPPWPFATYSERARGAVTDHYETLAIDQIKALPIRKLAADNCAIFVWVIWPFMPIWAIVLEGWGVTYSGLAFDWVKLNPNGEGLHWGTNVDGRSSESRANAVNAVRKLRRPAMSSSERHRAGQPPHRLADVTRGTGGGLPLTHNFLDPARKPRAFLNSAVRNDKANSGIWAARVARLQTTRAAKEALIGIDLAAL